MTSENVPTLAAPVSRHFVSIEGEGPRLGQLTGFIEFGNAPPMDLAALVKLPACQVPPTLVFDVCALHTVEAVEQALAVLDAAVAELPQRFLVLEAREEQLYLVLAWLKATTTAMGELYLTLGDEPAGAPLVHLALWRNEAGDEALPVAYKLVAPYPRDARDALSVAGARWREMQEANLTDATVHVFPRIDWSSAAQREWLRGFYAAALSQPASFTAARLRLAVLEHEAVGVL
jgi:hypothetical protein